MNAAERELATLCASVGPPDHRAARLSDMRARTAARPAGSLGALDAAARQAASVLGRPCPGPLPLVASVLAGDHGVARYGTSPHPQRATGALLRMLRAGQAPLNLLADRAGARIETADLGLYEDSGDPRYKVGTCTRAIDREDAMARREALAAVAAGARFADERIGGGALVAVGEIGVGNTTAAAALAARLLDLPADQVVGAGSGLAPEALAGKKDVVRRAVERSRTAVPGEDTIGLLASLGGYEICGNVGVILAAARNRCLVVLDGCITAVAAVAAVRLCPAAREYLVAGHVSTEPAHRPLLRTLDLVPLLDLGMRLGSASGALLAAGLVQSALVVAALTPAARVFGLTGGPS
ncbi:nicotinate-nucleotide--dimethylbenzimidazole phosphoribosyltransferase [Streptomyces sp. NPDC026589]|uniref:nicotinate-nucleotide--dimethylbenzimidazole phosphoribosyltransferase n=1 Tax=Streptomyces sp. NPDC026589 TaxID=3155609 RepID=UPI0033EAB3AC